MKQAILIVNMGAPESEPGMKDFLFRMFMDKHILPLPWLLRRFLAGRISKKRYRKSWEKYELIGGSPLKRFSRDCCEYVAEKFPDTIVTEAYSYCEPFIQTRIHELVQLNIEEIIIVPLYPNYSTATTGSVKVDCDKTLKKYPQIKHTFISSFAEEEAFVSLWQTLISEHIEDEDPAKITIIGSFHSLPDKIARKSNYGTATKATAKKIVETMGLALKVGYQSQMRNNGWLGPNMKELVKSSSNKVVIAPLSFVCENLETMYDFDQDLIPYAKKRGIDISRIKLPPADLGFAKVIVDIVQKYIEYPEKVIIEKNARKQGDTVEIYCEPKLTK